MKSMATNPPRLAQVYGQGAAVGHGVQRVLGQVQHGHAQLGIGGQYAQRGGA